MQRLEVSGAVRHIYRSLGVKRLNVQCVLWFALHLLSEISLKAKFTEIPSQIYTGLPRYSDLILVQLEYSRQVFEKHSKTKYHETTPSGSRLRCGRTDRHNEANIRLPQFCETRMKAVQLKSLTVPRTYAIPPSTLRTWRLCEPVTRRWYSWWST